MAVQNNAISVGNNILVDTNLDLYANSITYRSISYRGYIGTVAGFSFGGANSAPSPPPGAYNPVFTPAGPFTLRTEIERYPFASESTITSIGTLNTPRGNLTGHSSATHVYGAGGISSYITPPYAPTGTVIDRFPYATPFVNSTSVGSLTSSRATSAGVSGENNGFVIGGRQADTAAITAGIDRFSFISTPTTTTSIGTDLAGSRQFLTGISGGKDGYVIGGSTAASGTSGITNSMWKLPYTSGSRTTFVGSLTVNKLGCGGVSGITDGYVIGGNISPAPASYTNLIERFPFSAEITNAFNTGSLTATKSFMSTQSSDSSGYSYGGTNTAPNILFWSNGSQNPAPFYNSLGPLGPGTDGLGFIGQSTTLEKFPYALGTVTGASVGTLTTGKWGCIGGQY